MPNTIEVILSAFICYITGMGVGFWAGWRMHWTHLMRTIKAQVINSPQTPIKVWDLGKDVPDRKIVCSKLDIDGQIVWDINFGSEPIDGHLMREFASALSEMLQGSIVADRGFIWGGDPETMAAAQAGKIHDLRKALAAADNEIDELKAEVSRLDAALGKYD